MNTDAEGSKSKPVTAVNSVDGRTGGLSRPESPARDQGRGSINRLVFPTSLARGGQQPETSTLSPSELVQGTLGPSFDWQAHKQNGTPIQVVEAQLAASLQGASDEVLARLMCHGVVLLLVGAVLLFGRLLWTPGATVSASPAPFTQRILLIASQNVSADIGIDRGFLQRRIPPLTVGSPGIVRASSEIGRGGGSFVDAGFITRGLDPEGSVAPIARTEVVTYAVRYGDTLWDIARKFNISQDTLWANNDLSSPDMLSVGEVLTIPPIDGLIYTVRRGDTLEKLAKRYRTTVEAIVNYAPNGLSEGEQPAVGQTIMIPGGVKPIPVRRTVSLTSAPRGALKGAGSFVMPVSGILTQGFHPGHRAIDVGAPKGTPVYAADAGYVAFAGWHPWGYGYAVEIDHGNGFRTLYAHLSWYAPDTGQSVKRGELIGGVGSTYGSGGWSTGPHLHFEIIQNGAKRNPCLFVPCP